MGSIVTMEGITVTNRFYNKHFDTNFAALRAACGDYVAYYDLGCYHAQMGKYNEAINFLTIASKGDVGGAEGLFG